MALLKATEIKKLQIVEKKKGKKNVVPTTILQKYYNKKISRRDLKDFVNNMSLQYKKANKHVLLETVVPKAGRWSMAGNAVDIYRPYDEEDDVGHFEYFYVYVRYF